MSKSIGNVVDPDVVINGGNVSNSLVMSSNLKTQATSSRNQLIVVSSQRIRMATVIYSFALRELKERRGENTQVTGQCMEQ